MRRQLNILIRAFTFLMIVVFVIGCGGSSNSHNNNTTNSDSDDDIYALPTASSSNGPFTASEAIYVSPSGNDSTGDGSSTNPYYTLTKAISKVTAGQGIYMRGGTYAYSDTVKLSQDGTSDGVSNPYYIWAYPNETPVLDFSGASGTSGRGIEISGAYWHLYHLEIENAGDNGIYISGSNNTIEYCILHNNGDSGLQISKSTACSNLVFNCDSYLNCDTEDSSDIGGNADGFSCKLSAGSGNAFVGCRSWKNSDDGWDLYETANKVVIINCWTWHNGDSSDFSYSGTWGGNGNGFKVGGNYYAGPHLVKNCVSFDNCYGKGSNHKGFDQNNNTSGMKIYNCLAWGNTINFSFPTNPTDSSNPKFIFKNNAAFGPVKSNTSFCSNTDSSYNTWDLEITATTNDFLSLEESLAKADRLSDGSLPDNNFAKLASGSNLIDKGTTYTGILYLPGGSILGSAPDLGAYECY